jgi:glycosyltransferase involved in cell wall biosynthesis
MKIAIISEVFLPNIGGMEIRYKELGRTLVKIGHQVELYTFRLNRSDPVQENMDGIIVHRIANAFRYFSSIWGLRNYPDVIVFTLALLQRKRELENFDVIVFNKWPVIPCLVLPKIIQAKFVVDWCEIYDNLFWGFIYRLMTSATGILHMSVNQKICDVIQEKYNVMPQRTKVILSGIESQEFSCNLNKKQNKNILFLGRLAKHKNPEFVIKAFLKGALGSKGYRLDVVGGGPLYSELKRNYGDISNITIHGNVVDLDKLNFLTQASLLVLPSRREGFPVVCAEASAAGTPTLTVLYPDNGTVNVVTQFGIGWVANANLDELAEKIERYGDMNYWEWRPVSRRCVDRARQTFDWSIVAEEFLEFVNDHKLSGHYN